MLLFGIIFRFVFLLSRHRCEWWVRCLLLWHTKCATCMWIARQKVLTKHNKFAAVPFVVYAPLPARPEWFDCTMVDVLVAVAGCRTKPVHRLCYIWFDANALKRAELSSHCLDIPHALPSNAFVTLNIYFLYIIRYYCAYFPFHSDQRRWAGRWWWWWWLM